MTATPIHEPTGVIHDIGYRHYDGRRLGRGSAVAALTLHSLRGVFGLGRPARSKIMPFGLLVVMLLPAVVTVAIMMLVKQQGMGYPGFTATMQTVLAIFLATQAPYLVAPDLRFRVLPLYLSRPVTVLDYVGAKLAAMTLAMLVLMVLPLTVMFLGELLADLPGPGHTGEFFAALATSVLYAVMLACVGTAIASFTPRRGLGVAAVIAFYLLTSAISGVIYGVLASLSRDGAAEWAMLINPFFAVDAVQVWLFDTPPGNGVGYPDGLGGPIALLGVLALIALAVLALIMRYRKAASS
ncbi:ABC transporter permease [Streptosporangium soli]|nr:ABC transporter permease [Streptosporangium sp. KLBMP 9127]